MSEDSKPLRWYRFKAHCELVVGSVVRRTYLTELGLAGCHLHLDDHIPAGTTVLLKVYAWPNYFQAPGVVSTSQQSIGTDVAFQKMETHHLQALERCLLEAEEKQRRS
jgi:hypothetical protein